MKVEWFCFFLFMSAAVDCSRACHADADSSDYEASRALTVLCPHRLYLSPVFGRASRRYGVPADLLVAVARVESSCDPKAVGSRGERGLMQVLPGTIAAGGVSAEILNIPIINVGLGAAHLLRLYRLCGDWAGALGVYKGWRKCGRARTSRYAERVLDFWHEARGGRDS